MATVSGTPSGLPVKLTVGLDMLSSTTGGEHDAAVGLLSKILGNILGSPQEAKFRSLRMGNPKISGLLATSGVRAILTGAGFVQEGDTLVLPPAAPLDALQQAIDLLQAQSAQRAEQENAANAQLQASRKEALDRENEERKRMKMQIADDADARKEPGWKAKAAGVKDGKAITGCGDIGIGQSSGG